eukprot:scaffold45156_cov63-Phaeocystis_antarctica.AAC.8
MCWPFACWGTTHLAAERVEELALRGAWQPRVQRRVRHRAAPSLQLCPQLPRVCEHRAGWAVLVEGCCGGWRVVVVVGGPVLEVAVRCGRLPASSRGSARGAPACAASGPPAWPASCAHAWRAPRPRRAARPRRCHRAAAPRSPRTAPCLSLGREARNFDSSEAVLPPIRNGKEGRNTRARKRHHSTVFNVAGREGQTRNARPRDKRAERDTSGTL